MVVRRSGQFASWAFYGSGASIELAGVTERTAISLRFSALAGAFLVGVAGARWVTNEADKQLLKETVRVGAANHVWPSNCPEVLKSSARQVLQAVEDAAPIA